MKQKFIGYTKMRGTRPFLLYVIIITGLLFIHINLQPARISAASTHVLTILPENLQAGQDLALANITSTPAGINCGQGNTQCSAQFEEGSKVTLTGTVFGNRSDIAFQWYPVTYFHAQPNYNVPYLNCADMNSMGNLAGNTCIAPMPAADVSIYFSAAYTHSPLVIKKGGTGTGTVANQNPVKPPLLINCGTLCTADISSNLILFAIPDPGSVFAGWDINGNSSADCGPTNYNSKCLATYQENPRGDGKTDTFVAIFNKLPATSRTSGVNNSSPAAPTVEVKIDNKTTANTDKPVLKSNVSLMLSGKTIVSGIVTIYVFSKPTTYSTVANQAGNWALTLPLKSLSAGNHHIEADVTDPITHKISPRTQVLAFDIAGITTSNTPANHKLNLLPLISAGLAIAVIIGCLTFFLIRKHRNKQQLPDSTDKSDLESLKNTDGNAH